MATAKAERLINLVICLLSTKQFVPAEKIRTSVVGYKESPTYEAFSRMFERDKNELRDLGIPLETGKTAFSDTTEGYRINRTDYELPDIELTHDEAAAVAVATRLWESPEFAAAAQTALLKLRAAGIQVDEDQALTSVATAAPRSRGSEPALAGVLGAIDTGQAIEFDHRSSRTAPFARRTVEPWAVVTLHGRWYLVGHDRDRDAPRTFRLSRIHGEVTPIGPPGVVHRPEGVDPREIVADAVSGGVATESVRAWVAADRVHELRRVGTIVEERELAGRAGTELEIPVHSRGATARIVVGYGADAVALAPPDFRADVVARLQEAAGIGAMNGEDANR
ncbi:YafY family protein [Speluncibacter jeojiensis]|uniref:YafY family transcriptional regulator n=1 Tax=Speluncibacter jeojiensis TaxID=2710754 RepID=A0A9X4M385_9ACTN|nr:YafY family transcriptional regulator [Corynebacteriales bacterium D3-21]